MFGEIGKGGKFDEVLAGWRLVDDLVLEDPGEVVGDEDGVESRGECGVDIGARAVADHPGGAGFAAVMERERDVGFGVLFREDFDGAEVRGEAGAVELVLLLLGVALGDQDDSVTGGEVGQRTCNVGQELDLLVGDGLGEAGDAFALFGGERFIGELFEAGDERLAEAVETVSVCGDGGVLDAVEVAADLFIAVNAVIEVGDERGDSSLEVDVVLPERIVGVYEERLSCGVTGSFEIVTHPVIIERLIERRICSGAVVDLQKILQDRCL
jgi:hypothetical protein